MIARLLKAACFSYVDHFLHQLIQADILGHKFACYFTAIDDHNTVSNGVYMHYIMIDENGGLSSLPDPVDEIDKFLGFL